MTEERIKQIVENVVRKYVGQILEYAHPRKQFIERAEGLFRQIVIHYFLIKYHTNSPNIPHWKHELMGWFGNMANMDIKGNNNFKVRHNALITALNNMDFLNDTNAIYKCVAWKAEQENVDLDNENIPTILKQCQRDLNVIAEIIANNDYNECKKFINQI